MCMGGGGDKEREKGQLVFSSSGLSFCSCRSRGLRCLADAGVMAAFPWRLVRGGSRFMQETTQINSLFLHLAICHRLQLVNRERKQSLLAL